MSTTRSMNLAPKQIKQYFFFYNSKYGPLIGLPISGKTQQTNQPVEMSQNCQGPRPNPHSSLFQLINKGRSPSIFEPGWEGWSKGKHVNLLQADRQLSNT